VLPIAAFAAVVQMTNRMSNESELVVARATGVSVWRLARPVALFGLVVSLMMAVLVHFLVPNARTELAKREAEIAADVSARILTEGRFLHPVSGITFYLREITPDGELRDVFLSDARGSDRRVTYMARQAFLVRENGTPKLVMFDGTAQTLNLRTGRLFTTSFEDFAYDIGDLITGGTRVGRDARELPTALLLAPTPQAMALTGDTALELRLEGHMRLAQPLQPLMTALIGFAALMVGGFSRFGIWRQVVFAVALMIGVQILENAALGAARAQGQVWLIYLSPVVALAVAAALLWQAERPGLWAMLRRRRHDGGSPT
jgi:lipopolysaccharide export system permease protein